MSNYTVLKNNFSSGALSPKLLGRSDSAPYVEGCSTLINFLPTKEGYIRKRPGTRFIAATKNDPCRLYDHYALDGSPLVIELATSYAEIYDADTHASVSSVSPTYTASELFDLQIAQIYGELWIVHPDHKPLRLYWDGSDWATAEPTFTGDRTFASAGKYPSVIGFYSGRLFLGATDDEPYAIFASKTPNATTGATQYTNFTLGTDETDAIYLLESDIRGRKIEWFSPCTRFMAGTNRNVWMSNSDAPIPATFDMNITSSMGVCNIPALMVDNVLICVGLDKKTVYALVYSNDAGGYVAQDISFKASHLLSSGIVEFKAMYRPEKILWFCMEDGSLVSCSIDFQAGFIGWAKHELGGNGVVDSIAVVQKDTADELWMVVERDTRTIEYLVFDNLDSTAIEDSYYVDCGEVFTSGTPTDTITGLSWLSGQEVVALADGAELASAPVSDTGEITYDRTFSKCSLGYAYTSDLIPVPPELNINGTWQGKNKRCEKATLRLYRSRGGSLGTNVSDLQPLPYQYFGTALYGDPPDIFTGDISMTLSGIVDTSGQVLLRHSEPVPFNLLALIERIAILEA